MRRTSLDLELREYGRSEAGVPLRWIAPAESCKVLLVAAIHGEEPETAICLSRAYRSLEASELSPHVGAVLCANPDGVQLGTRGNRNGVDLNRNFPTADWHPDPSTCRWHIEDEEELPIGTGNFPGSETETSALVELIESASPGLVIALHGPLACIDDADATPAGKWIAEQTGLPLVDDVGYPTPGSLGTWGTERGLPVITWEFPADGIESLSRSQTPVLADILRGQCWESADLR